MFKVKITLEIEFNYKSTKVELLLFLNMPKRYRRHKYKIHLNYNRSTFWINYLCTKKSGARTSKLFTDIIAFVP
jgi:hypothetical protein